MRRVLALAALACATACGPAPPPRARPPTTPSSAPAGGPAWLRTYPRGCALGQSGPTLRPTDALREARRRAQALLLPRVATIRVRATQVTRTAPAGTQVREIVLEESEGWVRRSLVAALWYDDRGAGPGGAAGAAYALACFLDGDPDAARWVVDLGARRAGPVWLYSGPAGRLCAVGMSGPTLDPADAPRNADEAAREQLAQGLAVHVKGATAIYGTDEVLYGAVTAVPDGARAEARGAPIVARWSDAKGVGPVPFPGMAYALACAP